MPDNPSYKRAKTPRLTQPRGTFLSNPSTAADGFLGGAQGMNAPQVPSYVGLQTPKPFSPGVPVPQFGYPAIQSGQVRPVSTNTGPAVLMDQSGNPLSGSAYQSIRPQLAWDVAGNQYKLDSSTGQYVRGSSSAFTPSTDQPKVFDPLVGMNLEANPKRLEFKTAMQIFAGLPNDEVISKMAELGYNYVPGPRGGMFALGDTASPGGLFGESQGNATGGGVTSDFVDGASLAPGEVVKTSYGTFTGGTPTKEGVGQYALAFKMRKGQNYNTVVKKDSAGNWVRYSIPVYDRKKSRGQRARAQAQAQAQASTAPTETTTDSTMSNQLVNLRVNYG